ncbi:hypothetical protein POVWA2_012400 [Plasmodium ovale wallikeri]|uniref:Uncharacterized protein n=1 Tax=Plasmodium ovale wallikeri TaxID=864142 RepID=A0A1A8YLE5_PLAOA|nr:hypothetical protein POVWA1_011700 [Plasmodium ovale wallikeri]SBT32989.1 hypothetical protein POVWA2_012400 [Plasmodium ovale wallikeri]
MDATTKLWRGCRRCKGMIGKWVEIKATVFTDTPSPTRKAYKSKDNEVNISRRRGICKIRNMLLMYRSRYVSSFV